MCQKELDCKSLLKSSLGVGAGITPPYPTGKKEIQLSKDKDVLFVATKQYDFFFSIAYEQSS